jgi:uncharacterized membrane protein
MPFGRSLTAVWRRLTAIGFYPTLFWGYVGVALLIFTFLVPPFQKSDEPAHYYRAVSLTNLAFVCSKDANGQYYFNMKQRYAGLPAEMHVWDVAFQYNKKFDLAWLRTDFSQPFFNETVPVYDTCNLPPVGYVPNALGILAGKPFQNPLIGFYLGRIFGALFFIGAVVLALRIVPQRYKLVVYLYAAIPMVLHQVGAISYDAVHLSLFPLLFAYVTRFLTVDEAIKPRDLLVFMGLLWWTINVRSFAYDPLLLLFFLVPHQRIATPFAKYVRVTGAFVGFTAVTTGVFGMLYLSEDHLLTPDSVGISASSQVKFVLLHPWDFVAASYRTLQIHGELLMRQGIGDFGWIDYAFNFVPYYAVVVVAGLLVYYVMERDLLVIKPAQLAVLWVALAGTLAALFLSLYAVWSPVGAGVVGGLQGRYFLGLLPFGIFALSQTALTVGKGRFVQTLVLLLGLVLLASMLKAVAGRYY